MGSPPAGAGLLRCPAMAQVPRGCPVQRPPNTASQRPPARLGPRDLDAAEHARATDDDHRGAGAGVEAAGGVERPEDPDAVRADRDAFRDPDLDAAEHREGRDDHGLRGEVGVAEVEPHRPHQGDGGAAPGHHPMTAATGLGEHRDRGAVRRAVDDPRNRGAGGPRPRQRDRHRDRDRPRDRHRDRDGEPTVGQVGHRRGELVTGPRREHRAEPLVELGHVQATVHDGTADDLGDPFTVSVGGTQRRPAHDGRDHGHHRFARLFRHGRRRHRPAMPATRSRAWTPGVRVVTRAHPRSSHRHSAGRPGAASPVGLGMMTEWTTTSGAGRTDSSTTRWAR